jgi:hypothetical protein
MHEATSEPLSPRDREEILVDLEDLEIFQTLLEPRGVRGLVVDCLDCDAPHYFEWELLRSNLRHLLDAGGTRVHEPAYDPDPADYVSWEYAQGFADGVLDSAEHEDDEMTDSDGDGNRNGGHGTPGDPRDPGDPGDHGSEGQGSIDLR